MKQQNKAQLPTFDKAKMTFAPQIKGRTVSTQKMQSQRGQTNYRVTVQLFKKSSGHSCKRTIVQLIDKSPRSLHQAEVSF